MKITAIVPAKGESIRVPNKNSSIIDGEQLYKRKLMQLADCPEIDHIYLDTEDITMGGSCQSLEPRISWLERPKGLASNSTDGHELFTWEVNNVVESDLYIQALCTAPFLDSETISLAIKALLSSPQHDSLVAVSSHKQYTWSGANPSYGRGRIPNSVDLSATTVESMSLYICRKSVIASGKRFGDNPLMFELNTRQALDINNPSDLELARSIANGDRAAQSLKLRSLSHLLTTPLISDLLVDMGSSSHVLPSEIRGVGKFLGQAKTLQLGPVQEGGSWEGIYGALDSYDYMCQGDVIMVGNLMPKYSYFGGLNASIATRAGAVGVVVDGLTRDREEVSRLNLPVYARGYSPMDIRKQGTMHHMNLPIQIGKTTISNGDYVLADSDGVVVVPKDFWKPILNEALSSLRKEQNISYAVANGSSTKDILSQEGQF